MKSTDSFSRFENTFSGFAKDHIAGHGEFHQMTQFPDGLWQKMIECRLFGIGVEVEHGGHGGDSRSIAISGETLVEQGGNLGIALTWMMHELISRWLITRFGSQSQKNKLLPKLARGEITVSFAASEPTTGAHPKFIKTTAEPIDEGYRLNGEKAYLTNCPLADMFIVIAVTGNQSDNKEFSAFLVPKNSSGLSVTSPTALPILRPSPHGGIVLSNCIVTSEDVFGMPGNAYKTIVKPFREIEDTMLMGPISGGFQFQLNRLKQIFLQRDEAPDDDLVLELGQLQCATESLFALAMAAAHRLDQKDQSQPAAPLTLYFRNQAATIQDRLNRIIEETCKDADPLLASMAKDATGALRIASNVAKIKVHRIGEAFFKPNPSNST